MRPVTWLHVSDFHFRDHDSWSQNAVLSAMLAGIASRCASGLSVDFVLASGDLAFSGHNSQYDLVGTFFRDLASNLSLPTTRIFCVPGNHDVQRDRRTTCFAGAQVLLQSHNDVYAFLADTEERNTLLARQENFRRFQADFFAEQPRTPTADDLGYVSTLIVDDFRIAILGLNSAWLSQGGTADERQLLVGEHQATNAIDIAAATNPHVVIAIQHHPFDHLRRFDQRSTQRRLQEACHFIHCGHLHEPDATAAATQSGSCLAIAAGASFESRVFRNAYTVVQLDPLTACTDVTFVQYDPTDGAFSYVSHRRYIQELATSTHCTTPELANAIQSYCPPTLPIPYYLASLLLGDISDVPIPTPNATLFGTPDFLNSHLDTDFASTTARFLTVGRAVCLLYEHKPLQEILQDHAAPIEAYVTSLAALCPTHAGLLEQLMTRNDAAASIAEPHDANPFHHTLTLLDEYLAAGDWDGLRELASRSCDLPDPAAAAVAKRMLALCLARSSARADRDAATDLYCHLADSAHARADDWAALAALLTDNGRHEEAKAAIRDGVRLFPHKIAGFIPIGMRIVEATGDLTFRDELRGQQREETLR